MMRWNAWVCPVRAFSSRRRTGGFSVVELMVTVALLGIGTALAIPSYQDMVEKRQLTHGVEQVSSFVNSVQSTAFRTNEQVTVSWSRTSASNWCIGAIAGDTACDCTESDTSHANYCDLDSTAAILNASHAGGLDLLHAVEGDGAFTVDPVRGLFVDLNDSLEMKMRSRSGDFRINIQVNNTGRVITCSDGSDYYVPGYDVCTAPVVEEEAEPVEEELS